MELFINPNNVLWVKLDTETKPDPLGIEEPKKDVILTFKMVGGADVTVHSSSYSDQKKILSQLNFIPVSDGK